MRYTLYYLTVCLLVSMGVIFASTKVQALPCAAVRVNIENKSQYPVWFRYRNTRGSWTAVQNQISGSGNGQLFGGGKPALKLGLDIMMGSAKNPDMLCNFTFTMPSSDESGHFYVGSGYCQDKKPHDRVAWSVQERGSVCRVPSRDSKAAVVNITVKK